jgi:hypothetical protein
VMAWQVVSACYRIILALEAYVPRGHIVALNLTFAACKGVALANSVEKIPV